MAREVRIAMLDGWSVITNMSGGGDYLAISGTVWDHPNFRNGEWVIPGTFASFDVDTMIGVSISGRQWMLGDFVPTGNAPTLEDAITFIKTAWTKQ